MYEEYKVNRDNTVYKLFGGAVVWMGINALLYTEI